MLTNNYDLGADYLKVIEIGITFMGRFGKLKGKPIKTIRFEKIERLNGIVISNNPLTYNGIKGHFPGETEIAIGDVYKIDFSSVSHSYEIDIWGTATINYSHLEKIDLNLVEESQKETEKEKELENIDTVYKGPGKQFKFEDLKREFEK